MSIFYSYRILLFLLSLIGATIGATFAFLNKEYVWGAFFCTVSLSFLVSVFHYINSANRKLSYFFESLKNEDYTIHFIEKEGIPTERMLNKILNHTKELLQKTKIEIQQKEKYYELILNSITSGVVALDPKGFVVQSNQFALKILGLEVFTHTSQLQKVSKQLRQAVEEIKPGESKRITYTNERGAVQLLINATTILINGKEISLLVLNDIENEMDEKEIDSWIRLIRVLAHEIMNSIAPITSLSDTLLSLHKEEITDSEQIKKNTIDGLQAISETGKGLISFVESYRKFTRIPKPEAEQIDTAEFIDRMVILCSMEPNFKNTSIQTEFHPQDVKIFADPNLLGQVMLNIMKNAIQAMNGRENSMLLIMVEQNAGNTQIKITDNGPGIPPEIVNEIFVPFFTTKQEGTGIGLSIARQIMRAHGGNIKVASILGKETTFTLSL